VRAAQELLGAPAIGGGSAQPESGGGGSQKSQISLPSRLECTKTAQNRQFKALIDLKTAENAFFLLKST
jgi:hypothetical protein